MMDIVKVIAGINKTFGEGHYKVASIFRIAGQSDMA